MKGFWKLENNAEILKMSGELKEKWVDFQIIKLTKSELVLKDESKTYYTIKTKPLGQHLKNKSYCKWTFLRKSV